MDDTISRQATLEALLDKGQHSRRYKLGDIWELNFDEIREVINALPAVDSLWTPCNVALPREQEEVIVSCHDDSGDSAYDYTSSGWYTAAGKFWVIDNEINRCVVAWMPLPEPYREERDGKE